MNKSALKKRSYQEGVTGQSDLFPDMPHDLSVVHFPGKAVRQRVIIERPAPPPVRRICATCGALFDDHTQRPNTLYCRPSCKTRMSGIKREGAIRTLATMPAMDMSKAAAVVEMGGLPKAEKLLNSMGYTFSRDAKEWVK